MCTRLATFNKSRRKIKKIEMIYNLIIGMVKDKIVKLNNVYNIINKNNIDLLF
jgi:hypothetical protein